MNSSMVLGASSADNCATRLANVVHRNSLLNATLSAIDEIQERLDTVFDRSLGKSQFRKAMGRVGSERPRSDSEHRVCQGQALASQEKRWIWQGSTAEEILGRECFIQEVTVWAGEANHHEGSDGSSPHRDVWFS